MSALTPCSLAVLITRWAGQLSCFSKVLLFSSMGLLLPAALLCTQQHPAPCPPTLSCSAPPPQDMEYRKGIQAMELVWRGSASLQDADIFTGNFASGEGGRQGAGGSGLCACMLRSESNLEVKGCQVGYLRLLPCSHLPAPSLPCR